MDNYPYCACIAIDVRGSEKIENKGEIYRKLSKMAYILNRKYKGSLLVSFGIRKGDELIGVVSTFAKGYKIYQDIRLLAWRYEVSLYFGLGLGKLETGEVKNLDKINGTAIINAFRARDECLKKNDAIYVSSSDHVLFFAKGETNMPSNIINAMIYTIYNEMSGRTQKQKELMKILELNPEMTYEEIGQKLGYKENSKENVSKLLNRTNYTLYKEMKNDLIDFLIILQNMFSLKEDDSNE